MEPNERRPDVDIEEEIELLTRSFAPLKASRGYFTVKCTDGHVVAAGNIRSPQARRVLLDNLPHIRGVVDVDSTNLYDDEMVRLSVGQLLPAGVLASVHYGAVALTGRLPEGASADMIVNSIQAVKGVRRVGAQFGAGALEAPEKIEPK